MLAEGKELLCVYRGDAWILIKEHKVSLQSSALVAAEPHWHLSILQNHHHKLPPTQNSSSKEPDLCLCKAAYSKFALFVHNGHMVRC